MKKEILKVYLAHPTPKTKGDRATVLIIENLNLVLLEFIFFQL